MLQRSIIRASRQATRQTSFIAPTRQQVGSTRAAAIPAIRWYSESPSPKEGEAAVKKEDAATSTESTQLQEQIEKKDREIIDLKDKYLRSVADFRNLQERTKREIQAAKDFALQRFARDLVESVDNLDRALSTVPAEKLAPPATTTASTTSPADPNATLTSNPNQDLMNLHSGIKMTDSILMNTLKKHGLERFDPSEKEEKFNPNVHEAVFQAPQPGKEDGVCFHTQQKGFLLNGRVLRPAKVGVVKNS